MKMWEKYKIIGEFGEVFIIIFVVVCFFDSVFFLVFCDNVIKVVMVFVVLM